MSLMPTGQKDRRYMLLALRIIGDFGATIAVPIVVFVLIGKWIERTYGGGSWPLIGAFVLAALVSGRMIYKKAKMYGKEYSDIDTQNKL